MSASSQKPKRPRATAAIRSLRDSLGELAREEESNLTCGQVLLLLSRRYRTLGRSLVWLVAYERAPETLERAFALLMAAHQEPGVPSGLRDKVARQAIELAERAIRDPGVPDERKLRLNAVLAYSGRELTREELEAFFEDLPKAIERMTHQAGSTMLDTAEQVEGALQATGLVDAQGQGATNGDLVPRALAVAALAAQANGRVGATVLAVTAAVGRELGHPVEEELCMSLEAAAKADSERALWLLAELGGWPNTGGFGAKARELSMRLRVEGVTPRPVPAPVFSHGLVSMVDGSGSRALLLLFRQGEGALDALSFVLNDRVGLKDVWCAFEGGAQVERQFREAGIPLASCDRALARELLADALATSESSGRPVPGRWLLYRSFLGADPLELARRTPNLGAYMLETIVRSPKLAEGSDALIEHDTYDRLGFDSDAAYTFVRNRILGRKRLRITDTLVDEFLGFVEGYERKRVTRRLAVNLEHQAHAGRAKSRVNRLAARTLIVLNERLCPFEEIPYVRELAGRSLGVIEHNVAHGFESQEEANQASLEEDMEQHAMAAELAGFAKASSLSW